MPTVPTADYNITMAERLAYTPLALAVELHVSSHTLRKWRELHKGPRSVKMEGQVRYLAADVEEWLKSLPSSGDPALRGLPFGSNHLKAVESS